LSTQPTATLLRFGFTAFGITQPQSPGGWNRLVLAVSDLPALVASLRDRGVSFRNEIEVGPGGKQIQVLDPDGNPIELFEPASRS